MKTILTAHPESCSRTLSAVCISIALFCSSLLPANTMAQTRTEASIEALPYAQAAIEAAGYQGNILIYDLNRDTYYAANVDSVTQAHIPASTFKIMSSLVAIEAGLVAHADTVLPWDGVSRGRTETNADLTLRDAFRLSSVPHYQALVRAVGAPAMQRALSDAGYGNQIISGGIDQFWLSGGLRISPMQQIDLLRRLYHQDLPFSATAMNTVKDIMVTERTDAYVLRAKTGLAILNEDENTGWWVGWVEHGSNVTMFATVLTATAPDADFIPARLSVTRDVLQELGVLPVTAQQ
jgi:beta-lactamase class D